MTKRNTMESAVPRTQNRKGTLFGLYGVRRKAEKDKEVQFTALLHHLTIDLLEKSFRQLKRSSAPGIDNRTWKEYNSKLTERLPKLLEKTHTGKYRAQPERRVYIEKDDGRKRALGLLGIEDKILQQAISTILNQIYETDFLGFSYGFRRGKSQHDALDALTVGITRRKISWILDADIEGFFDNINHSILQELIKKRIGDKRILRLINKWIKTGYREKGKTVKREKGIPQGAVISPLLSNIFLHYVFDLWIANWRKTRAKGDIIIVRYADDWVAGFQYKSDAEQFLCDLSKRLSEYELKLHRKKTRLIEFGRFAESNYKKRDQKKPETFNFLGFTHICSKNSKGYYVIKRKTSKKKLKKKLKEVKKELKKRMHAEFTTTAKWINSVIMGHQNYYAVPGNMKAVKEFYTQIIRTWIKILRKRSHKGRNFRWDKYVRKISRLIKRPRLKHPYPNQRFNVRLKVGAG